MEVIAQLVANSLIAGSLFALVAMSFNFIYGVSRAFNLAHGSLGAIAAYSLFFLAVAEKFPLWVAVPAGVLAAALTGLVLERIIFKPLRAKRASDKILIIASLGVMVAVESVSAIFFTSQFHSLNGLVPNPTYFIGSAAFTAVQAVMLASSFILFVFFWSLLSYTRFGKAVRAIADDEEVANIVGIDTTRIIATVTLIGSGLMGFAGILGALDLGIDPRFGFLLLLDGAIASVVGGIGSVYGAFLAAYLLGFAENFGVWFLSGEWKYAIAFFILILFLLFRPEGFFGKKLA